MSYYAGDPGFFSVIKNIGSGLASFIPGVGPAISRGLEKLPLGTRAPKMLGGALPTIRAVKGAIIKHPVLSAAGAAGAAAGVGALAERELAGGGGGCPRGFHISKSRHAKHFGACVRNRRMRVTNVRALRRAIRRAHGFARIARKVMSFTSPHKKRGHGYFRRPRRKK